MERIMGQAKAQAVATYNAAIQAGRSNPQRLLKAPADPIRHTSIMVKAPTDPA